MNIDEMCAKARESLNRSIGIRAGKAKAAIAKDFERANREMNDRYINAKLQHRLESLRHGRFGGGRFGITGGLND